MNYLPPQTFKIQTALSLRLSSSTLSQGYQNPDTVVRSVMNHLCSHTWNRCAFAPRSLRELRVHLLSVDLLLPRQPGKREHLSRRVSRSTASRSSVAMSGSLLPPNFDLPCVRKTRTQSKIMASRYCEEIHNMRRASVEVGSQNNS